MALNPRRRARSIDVSERALDPRLFVKYKLMNRKWRRLIQTAFPFFANPARVVKIKVALSAIVPVTYTFLIKESFNPSTSRMLYPVNLL